MQKQRNQKQTSQSQPKALHCTALHCIALQHHLPHHTHTAHLLYDKHVVGAALAVQKGAQRRQQGGEVLEAVAVRYEHGQLVLLLMLLLLLSAVAAAAVAAVAGCCRC